MSVSRRSRTADGHRIASPKHLRPGAALRCSLVILMVPALGCGTIPVRPTRYHAADLAQKKAIPIPDDLKDDVARAETIGADLYRRQLHARIGLEFLRDKKQPLDGLGSWLIMGVMLGADGKPEGAPVLAVATAESPPRLAYEVDLAISIYPTFRRRDPPVDITPGPLEGFLAIERAAAAVPKLTGRYDQILSLASYIGEEGGLVYLIAESDRPDDIVLGMHYRVLVDDTGTVAEVRPLSDSAASVSHLSGESADGKNPPGVLIQHNLTASPLETHVLESLRHGRVPLLVVTPRGSWRVTGDHVEYLTPERGD